MDNKMWDLFLDTFNPIKDYEEKALYDGEHGKRYVYKCDNGQFYFGYVLDKFTTSAPQLVTAFFDHENNINNWFNNVVNGRIHIQKG